MLAIYKRELRSYFQTVIGWLFIAATLALIGLYFTVYCLYYGYPYISYALSSVAFLFFISIPVLTMRILAEERKQKTDQLILTAPITVGKIVIGKYLAMLTILGVAIAIVCTYPVILSSFGTIPMLQSYTAILGYFLMGALCIAIGMFVSSITESQVIAAVITFAALFTGYMMNSICSMISEEGNFITSILRAYDLATPLNNFMNGMFDMASFVYYLSLTLFFIFLTCQSIQKRRWNVSTKSMKTGAFSASLVAVSVVVVVMVNLVVKEIPIEYTQYDVTSQKLYSLTNTTKEYIKNLDKDVTLYVIAAEETADSTLAKTLEMYADMSSHITVEYKDPTKYPNFYKEYSTSLSSNSVIVECGDKFKVVDYNDVYEYSIDYTTYTTSIDGYDGEGQLTSAISYVVSDSTPVVYLIEGHDEMEFGEDFQDVLSKQNIDLQTLSLMQYDEIPEDASCIMLLGPSSDLSEDDAEKIINYINNGGKAIITVSFTETELPNFDTVLAAVGAENTYGIILEGNSSNYYQVPYYILPTIASVDMTANISSSKYIFAPYSMALNFDTEDETYTFEDILTTTSSAYAKIDTSSMTTYDKEDGDIEGTFTIGTLISKTVTNSDSEETTAQVALFAASYLFTDTADSMVSGANSELFSGVAASLIDNGEENSAVSIGVKAYTLSQLTIPDKSVATISAVVTIAMPVIMLLAGIVIWVRRRKR